MTRFGVEGEGDGDEIEGGPSNSNHRPLPKKPRINSDRLALFRKRASASTSAGPQIPSIRESPPEKRIIPTRFFSSDSDEEEEYYVFPPLEHSSEELPRIVETADELEGDGDDDDDDEDEEMGQQIVGSGGGGAQPTQSRDVTRPDLEARSGSACAPGAFSVTLTDPDVLDCAICFEPLNPPVYQCENGHTACASCCTKMKNKCASCSWPIGYNRCRAIEKVLESIRIPCPNIQHGCIESLTYCRKLNHIGTCKFSPVSCPHPNCFYIALPKSVYTHFVSQHLNSFKLFCYNSAISISLDNNQKHAFLCEVCECLVFVLNRSIEPRGSLVEVVCILPTSSRQRFSYEVSASDGVSSIILKTTVEKTTCWTGQAPDKKYLFVPNDLMSSAGQLKLGLTIRNR